MGWRGVLALVLGLSGLMSGVQAQPWQSGAWRTDWWRNGATLDMDFAKNRYMVSLTAPVTYTSLTQFITAVSGTFTRAGANETATGDPFYLAANQGFVSRATSATYIDSSGVVQTAAANVARTNYTYNGSTWVSGGTLVEPARTNYVTPSTQAGSFYGTASVYVTDNYTTAPDGTSTASRVLEAGNYQDHYLEKTLSLASNQAMSFSTFIKPATRRRFWVIVYSNSYADNIRADCDLSTQICSKFSKGTGSATSATLTPLANGWYRLAISGQPTTSSVSDTRLRIQIINGATTYTGTTTEGFYIWGSQLELGSLPTSYIATSGSTVTRAADVYTSAYSGTYFDSTGTLRNAPANTPRLDYDPSTSEPRGVLIEEARTNYVSRSESGTDITSGNTNPLSFVTATNVLAPNGSGTMLKCVGGNGGSDICRWIINMAPATTYTVSLFMKLAERPYLRLLAYDRSGYIRSSSVNLQNGTIAGCNTTMPGSESIQSLSNGIYRVAMTFTTSSTDLGYGSYFDIRMVPSASSGCSGDNSAADGVSGVYFWGAQLERGAFPTSYIPTSGSTVTRAADVFTIPASGGWYNSMEGTPLIIADHNSVISVTTGAVALELYKSTNVNCHRVLFGEDASGRHSYRMYGSDDCSLWNGKDGDTIGSGLLNMGGALKEGSSAIGAHGTLFGTNSVPMPSVDTMSVGSSHGYLFWNRPIRRVTYFSTRQPDYSLLDYTRRAQDN